MKYFSISRGTKNDVRFGYNPWKIYDFVSVPLFDLTLIIKLRDFDFESHWNTLIFFWKKNMLRQSWICPMEKSLIFFIFIVRVQFSHKTDRFWFWKSLKYFNSFWSKRWGQIEICPVKQCLIWFNFRCLSIIFAISLEIQILNFIEIVQLRNMLLNQNLFWTWLSYLYFFGIITEIVSN